MVDLNKTIRVLNVFIEVHVTEAINLFRTLTNIQDERLSENSYRRDSQSS